MLKEEFIKLTGFFPSEDLYAQIEKAYMADAREKEAFCKAYVKNEDGMAERIQYVTNMATLQKQEKHRLALEEKEKEIAQISQQLDRELKWTPYDIKGNVSQNQYLSFLNSLLTKRMDPFLSEDKCLTLLHEWFGFDKNKITIVFQIPEYQINRYGEIRCSDLNMRKPIYVSEHENYIRFDCGKQSYEMLNGKLRFFNSSLSEKGETE